MVIHAMKVRARVIGSLQDNYIDVLVGYDLGQFNGGFVQRLESVHFPLDCRMPNTYISIVYNDVDKSEILRIELDRQSHD